jgi:hypothetical protein
MCHKAKLGLCMRFSAATMPIERSNKNPDGYPLHSGTPNRLWFGDQSALVALSQFRNTATINSLAFYGAFTIVAGTSRKLPSTEELTCP